MNMFLISDNTDTYTGMRLAGIEGVIVHEQKEFQQAVREVVNNEEIGVLLINEGLCSLDNDLIDDIKLNATRPLIVEIPNRHGTGRKEDFITSYVTEAIGVKL